MIMRLSCRCLLGGLLGGSIEWLDRWLDGSVGGEADRESVGQTFGWLLLPLLVFWFFFFAGDGDGQVQGNTAQYGFLESQLERLSTLSSTVITAEMPDSD